MALFKATIFFRNGASGWTESFYNTSGSLSAVQSRLGNLIFLRQNMLPPANFITFAKISDVTTFRSAQFQNIPGAPLPGTYPLGADVALPPRVSVGVRMGTANGNNRVFPVRGLPSSVVLNDQYNAASPWNPGLTIFKNYLISGTDGWALASPTIIGDRFRIATGIDVTGLISLTQAPPFPMPAGLLAGLHRIHGIDPEPNRTFRVIDTNNAPNTAAIFGWRPRPAITTNFTVTFKTFAVSIITTAVTDVLSTRKTGRVPFLLRGRRSPDR
jgi:hypothetical protein